MRSALLDGRHLTRRNEAATQESLFVFPVQQQDAQDAAKSERLGLWRTDFQEPERWRREHRR